MYLSTVLELEFRAFYALTNCTVQSATLTMFLLFRKSHMATLFRRELVLFVVSLSILYGTK